MKQEPWAAGKNPAPEKPRREPSPSGPLAPLGPERPDEAGTLALLMEWEQRLMQLAPQSADQEYGRMQEEFRKIGVRLAHRVAAGHQNRCSYCDNVLPARGPMDTIPKPAPELALGWINQYACSTKCADELRAEMHEREFKRLSA